MHFGHGILSYYVFSFLDGEMSLDELIIFHPKTTEVKYESVPRRNYTPNQSRYRHLDKIQTPKTYASTHASRNAPKLEYASLGVGLLATLFSALAFEVFENSPLVIYVFRKNSGMQHKLVVK